MGRALLLLAPGLVVFVLVALAIAPSALVGRALLLATVAVVPGIVVLALAADARRRRRSDAGEP